MTQVQEAARQAQEAAGKAQEAAGQLLKSFEDIAFVQIAVIIALAWVLILIMQRVIPWVAEKLPSRIRLTLLPTLPLLRMVIMIVAVTRIVPLVINPTPGNLLALAGAGGVAVGFAFKDYVSSIFAGVVNLYERPCRAGDWIQVDDAYGEVKFLGFRAMQILTPDDTIVTVPNSKIWTDNIYNASDGAPTLMCVADFHVEPRHDASRARAILKDVALTSSYVKLDKPVAVIVSEKPWATHYRLKAYPIDGRDQFQFTSDLTVRGKAALMAAGIEPAAATAAVLSG